MIWMTPRFIFLPFFLYSKQYAHSLLELGLTAILDYYLVLILCELLAVLMYIQQLVRRDMQDPADITDTVRIWSVYTLLPVRDPAVAHAYERCKLLLTETALFPQRFQTRPNLVFHTKSPRKQV